MICLDCLEYRNRISIKESFINDYCCHYKKIIDNPPDICDYFTPVDI